MMSLPPPVRLPVGRLAPSPTGRLHVGHARSFLLAWWSIRSRGGRMVLRVEDLDTERSRDEFTCGILEDLTWLGMDWDNEPVIQSRSQPDFEIALARLIQAGHVYPCVCTRREVREASAPHHESSLSQATAPEGQGGQGRLSQAAIPNQLEAPYPGTCRDRFSSAAQAASQTGRQVAWRYRVPSRPVSFEDRIAGPQSIDLAAQGGDFLVARRDGVIAYQLAVVVDDSKSAISEVLRGDDLLVSTARQILIARALGHPLPSWAHAPLVQDTSQARLAKRTDALSLKSLRERGISAHQIIAWAAASSGQRAHSGTSPQNAADFLGTFNLANVPKTAVLEPTFV